MSSALSNAFWLFFVSLLWGSTNPLIRKGSKGIEQIHRSSRAQQFCAEVIFLASNWKYIVPFLLNQCGSVVFYLTLASVDLSIAVPITNSLTMLITTLAGQALGEGRINAGGMADECVKYHSRLVEMTTNKKGESYSNARIRAKVSFAIICSVILYA